VHEACRVWSRPPGSPPDENSILWRSKGPDPPPFPGREEKGSHHSVEDFV
jgi:hypothetical protein